MATIDLGDGNIEDRELVEEMRSSYMDYAMSVIVGRALPDARDGLKPVHRRVLFAMSELNNDWNRPYKKSARIVGDVIGKYHPHGDQSVYDTIVRMAQDFSMRHMLVDGQGNFGSVDGDPPAAMRYTEARPEAMAEAMMADLDKETVDFVPNYDETTEELASMQGIIGIRDGVLKTSGKSNPSARDFVTFSGRGQVHDAIVGGPKEVADRLEEMFVERGCDGFVIAATIVPGSYADFVKHVVPELQRRGLFHKDYAGKTLRENLGLPRPENRFFAAAQRAAFEASVANTTPPESRDASHVSSVPQTSRPLSMPARSRSSPPSAPTICA